MRAFYGATSLLVGILLVSPIDVAASGAANTIPLRVIVKGVTKPKGVVRVAVYQQSNFLKGSVSEDMRWLFKADTKPLQYIFLKIPAGQYAVVAFHDENNNGKLDRSPIGIPLEQVGFSNDAVGVAGPPTFQQAGFQLGPRPRSITINFG